MFTYFICIFYQFHTQAWHCIIHINSEANPTEEANTQEQEELVLVKQDPTLDNTNSEQAQAKPRCILPIFIFLTFTPALHYGCAFCTRN